MKIQVGPKGELAWDIVLDVLKKEEMLDAKKKESRLSRIKSCFVSAFDHRHIMLVLLLLAGLSYYLMYFVAARMSTEFNHGANIMYNRSDGKLGHVHFAWRSCGKKSDPIKLSKLTVSPDPVHLEKNITINVVSSLGIDIDADHPISADVTLERHAGFVWIELPCFSQLGSCFYSDVCKVIPFDPTEPCPDPFPRFNVPCHCPISHGIYNIRNGTFNLSAILDMFPIPHWLVTGDYYGKAVISRKNREIGCYEMYASVKA